MASAAWRPYSAGGSEWGPVVLSVFKTVAPSPARRGVGSTPMHSRQPLAPSFLRDINVAATIPSIEILVRGFLAAYA